MQNIKRYNFVLPSLKISGGIKETLNLANELLVAGARISYFVMWVSPNEITDEIKNVTYLSKFKTNARYVFFQLPLILFEFILANKNKYLDKIFVFTHYTTFPLSWVVPRQNCMFFVQDMEWHFVKNKFISNLLKRFILCFYRRGAVLTANRYLSIGMEKNGIKVAAELPIWANERFLADAAISRSIDLVMVLRKGDAKRLDLYLEFIKQANLRHKNWVFSVITPDEEIARIVIPLVAECHIKPSVTQMAEVYAKSKLFLMLSDHEGFGLPPLEAMGAGCLPICRDAGGIHAYMTGELNKFVVPLDMDVSNIIEFAGEILMHEQLAHYSSIAKKVFVDGLAQSSNRASTLLQLDLNTCH